MGVFPQAASEGPDFFWLTNLRHGQDHPSRFLFLTVQLRLVEEDSWKMLTSCQPTLQSYFLLQKTAKHPANCSIHLLITIFPSEIRRHCLSHSPCLSGDHPPAILTWAGMTRGVPSTLKQKHYHHHQTNKQAQKLPSLGDWFTAV